MTALQMRLIAAAMGFHALALTVHVDPFLHYMAMCWFFALLAIPLRVVLAVVEITDSLTGGKILGTQP